MCTVTYLPLQRNVIFTSNRDESPRRKLAAFPAIHHFGGNELLYPEDGAAGGTWIGLNAAGTLIILLNGGFETHTKMPSYRLSRGQIVKQILSENNVAETWDLLDLLGVEPFTLVCYFSHQLIQLVWTGVDKHTIHPDPGQPQIWSSATLYGPQIQAMRKKLFSEFIAEHPHPSARDIENFLKQHNDAENGFVMNRNDTTKTCSISIIEIKEEQAVFKYTDLLNNVSQTSHYLFNRPRVTT